MQWTHVIQSGVQFFHCTSTALSLQVLAVYSKFIFCSSNLNSDLTSPADEAFWQRLIDLASPQDIVFYDHIITLPELQEESNQGADKCLVFLDDFSDHLIGKDITCQLFTRLSSHSNIDIVAAMHSGINYKAGKNFGMITNSANVIILFRSLADCSNIGVLSKKIFPYCHNFLEKCMNQAPELMGNYSSIVVLANLDNDLNKTFMVRANLFGDPLLDEPLDGCETYGDNQISFNNPAYYASRKVLKKSL